MSVHSTYFGSAGVHALFRTHGEAVELIERGEEPESMTAIPGPEESVERKDAGGAGRERQMVRGRKFTITKDPDGEFGGAEDPQENATLIHQEVEYAVNSRHDAGDVWELMCRRVVRRSGGKVAAV